MAHEVRAVVAEEKGKPVGVETIVVPDPGPGEALVRVQACGVCHTGLHYREGAINDDFPFLLGHEAAGMVEAVGPDVDLPKPGDFVILMRLDNIKEKLLPLPSQTVAHTGHGDDTTIGDEAPRLDEWIARGS